jgi:hypothetical protein
MIKGTSVAESESTRRVDLMMEPDVPVTDVGAEDDMHETVRRVLSRNHGATFDDVIGSWMVHNGGSVPGPQRERLRAIFLEEGGTVDPEVVAALPRRPRRLLLSILAGIVAAGGLLAAGMILGIGYWLIVGPVLAIGAFLAYLYFDPWGLSGAERRLGETNKANRASFAPYENHPLPPGPV